MYTAEMFPTEIRHSLLGICSMFGRIGSMVAPQTPLLVSILMINICYLYRDIQGEMCEVWVNYGLIFYIIVRNNNFFQGVLKYI